VENFITISKEEINIFIDAIKSVSTYDFTDYSEKSFARRVERVLIDNKLDFPGLVNEVKKNQDFLEKIVKDITVNTTELFRDPPVWHIIKYRILPKFETNYKVNILHTGCSTGQEVYSMLILLHDMGLFEKANVFATDINHDVIEIAKKGIYKYRHNIDYTDNYNKVIKENPYNYDDYKDIPFTKYFEIDKVKDTIKMKPFLTQKTTFKKQDLVKDGNVFNTTFDIIFCRNILIYFNSKLQNKTFEMFHQWLNRNGILILGAHESMLGPVANKFVKKGKYYVKKDE
jgi:chemotaxis protein methyltransferase CheR